MSWSRNEVTLLIEEYRKRPNLYNVSSAHYKNRNLRQQALETIRNTIQELKPGVSILEIQQKFQGLKQNAIKEYKKWKSSLKSGAGEDEVYKPSLWYYDIISFLFENSEPREAQDTLNLASEEYMTSSDIDADNVLCGMVSPDGSVVFEHAQELTSESPLPSITVASSTSRNTQPQKKKQKRNSEDDPFLCIVKNSLESISSQLSSRQVPQQLPRSENQHFCDFLAQKFDLITDQQIKGDVQEKILVLLNDGINKCLQNAFQK